jgi:single-stranded DNA-binding protein
MSINHSVLGGVIVSPPQTNEYGVSFRLKTWRTHKGRVFLTSHNIDVGGYAKEVVQNLRVGDCVVVQGTTEIKKIEKNGQDSWFTQVRCFEAAVAKFPIPPEVQQQIRGGGGGQGGGNWGGGGGPRRQPPAQQPQPPAQPQPQEEWDGGYGSQQPPAEGGGGGGWGGGGWE